MYGNITEFNRNIGNAKSIPMYIIISLLGLKIILKLSPYPDAYSNQRIQARRLFEAIRYIKILVHLRIIHRIELCI